MSFVLEQRMYDELRDMCMKIFKHKQELPVNVMFERIMKKEDLPMHCPYHHFILPAALLTQAAIQENRKKYELEDWLDVAEERAKTVPGGFCGNCGSCGSGVGMGIFAAVYTGSSPMATDVWQVANEVTGRALMSISKYPGPRCCKRTAFLAAQEAVPFLNEKLGLHFTLDETIQCRFSAKNAECLKEGCPFYSPAKVKESRGFAVTVGTSQLPKPDPAKDCKCMHEPIDFTKKDGIITWLVDEGDRVETNQVICEGEIDKKVVEFRTPVAGILTEQMVDEGEVFSAGTLLAYIQIEE